MKIDAREPRQWGPWIGRFAGQNMTHLADNTVIDWMDASGKTCADLDDDETFVTAGEVAWDSDPVVVAYRVKAEPVIETVNLTYYAGAGRHVKVGTIDLVDGEPDCSSIKTAQAND